jgi:hypothetical protein
MGAVCLAARRIIHKVFQRKVKRQRAKMTDIPDAPEMTRLLSEADCHKIKTDNILWQYQRSLVSACHYGWHYCHILLT